MSDDYLSSKDSQLEARLSSLKQDARENKDPRDLKQIAMRYTISGKMEQARAWSKLYTDELQKRSDAGDIISSLKLALSYIRGENMLKIDTDKAIALLQKASTAGDPSGAYILAELYKQQSKDKLAIESYKRAYELYSQQVATNPKNPTALYWLGSMSLQGLGCAANPSEGLRLLNESAALKNRWAVLELFKCYTKGEHTAKDEAKAIHFAKLLADEHKESIMAYTVACAYLNAQGVEQNIPLGEQYLDLAVAGNVPDAITLKAARLDEAGKYAEAAPLYSRAASMGNDYAAARLGELLLNGADGIEQDPERAISLLQQASTQLGSPKASFILAEYYKKVGEPELANEYYYSASDRGVKEAMAARGLMHILPNSGMNWNPTRSYFWWKSGAEAGDATCQTYLNLFLFGFVPLLLIICFLSPILLINYLSRRRNGREKI